VKSPTVMPEGRSLLMVAAAVSMALALAGRRASKAAQDAAGSSSTRQLLSEPSVVCDRKRIICRARARPAAMWGTALVRSWLACFVSSLLSLFYAISSHRDIYIHEFKK
jgi:hypothetical protein